MSDHKIMIVREPDNTIIYLNSYGLMIEGATNFKLQLYNVIPEAMKEGIINFIENVFKIRVLILRQGGKDAMQENSNQV